MSHFMKRLTLLFFVLFTASLLLAACGGSEPEGDTGRTDEQTDSTEADAGRDEDTTTEEPTEEPTAIPEPTEEPTPVPEPTEEPTPVPDLTAGFATFSSPEGGFNVMHPEGWSAQDLFGFVILVSDEALLEADDFGEEGAAVLIVSDTQEALEIDGSDLGAALSQGAEQMDLGEGEFIEGPEAIMVNGQEGARAVMSIVDGDLDITAVLYVALSGDRVAIFIGMSPPAEAETNIPLFDAMAQTLEVVEPTEDVSDSSLDLGGSGVGESEGFLLFGDSVSGMIGDTGSSTWDFVGVAGETIDIVVSPSAEDLDVVVDVTDADGNSILPDGAVDNAFGTEEILDIEIAETGTFFVVVSGFDSSDVGAFQLDFNEAGAGTSAGGDGGSDSTPVGAGALGYEDTITGAVTSENPSPSYTFSGSAGDIINVVVDPDGDLDVVIDIIDSSGNSLLLAGSDNSFGSEITMMELPSDGEYSVVVSSFDDGVVGDFELSLGGPDGAVIFADNALEEDTEEHAFPFNAIEGEIVNILVVPEGDFDAVIQLFNDDTDEELFKIDRSFDSEALGYIIPEDGNYYFLVTGFVADEDNTEGGENLGNYDVMLFGTDMVLSETTVGDSINGVFSTDDGILEFFIAADAGEPINLTLESADGVDGVIEILDLDDNILASTDENVAGGTESLTFTAEEEGIVIIRVSEFFGLSGAFILSIDG